MDAVEGHGEPDAMQGLAHAVSGGRLDDDRESVVVLTEKLVQFLFQFFSNLNLKKVKQGSKGKD